MNGLGQRMRIEAAGIGLCVSFANLVLSTLRFGTTAASYAREWRHSKKFHVKNSVPSSAITNISAASHTGPP